LGNVIVEGFEYPTSLDDMGYFIVKVLNKKLSMRSIKNKVLHLSWVLEHSKEISCTHASPVGKPMNFYSNPDLPTSYPGWEGRIWMVFEKEPRHMGFDGLNGTHMHTGTGGYGNYNNPNFKSIHPGKEYPVSYSLRIFEDDWAAMKVNNNLISKFPKKHSYVYTLGVTDEES